MQAILSDSLPLQKKLKRQSTLSTSQSKKNSSESLESWTYQVTHCKRLVLKESIKQWSDWGPPPLSIGVDPSEGVDENDLAKC
jgi:hypothetical protein